MVSPVELIFLELYTGTVCFSVVVFFSFFGGGVRTSTQLVEKRSMAYVDKLILTFQIKSLFTKAAYRLFGEWLLVLSK